MLFCTSLFFPPNSLSIWEIILSLYRESVLVDEAGLGRMKSSREPLAGKDGRVG